MNRTWVAAALTAAALAVPLAAWYYAGSRAVNYQRRQLQEQASTEARQLADRLAERLAQRLESLRDLESHRPFYHYQNLFHDPRAASNGNSVSPSPLGAGPGDPLIRAYFQINADGRITLPTLNEDIPSLNTPAAKALQKPILAELKAAGPALTAALPTPPAGDDSGGEAEKPALEIIARNAWIQNQKANQVFLDLKRKASAPAEPAPVCAATPGSVPDAACVPIASPAPPPAERVYIHIGEFHWRTVTVAGAPALLALRQVRTPDGLTTQGFQLNLEAVKNWLQDATPSKFNLTGMAEKDATRLPLPETDWFVTVTAAETSPLRLAEAAALKPRFRRNFALGVLGALFAGSLMVSLVWLSERTARQRSRFAAAAAHELRTPLAGLRMYGEMLSEGLGDPAKSKDYARWIAGEADRLGRVVANVLEFTRLERGKLAVKPASGDLAAALRDCIARLRPSLTAADVTLDVTIAHDIPAVPFDRDALAQIIYNLVDNAEKYSRSCENRTIHISLAPADQRVILSVTDHGPGIPAAQRRRLFRPFSRGKGADLPAGLGLGLTIVQALIKAHGGSVAYESAEDGGARFRVEFPA
jgi:signal transduction histidine kinase